MVHIATTAFLNESWSEAAPFSPRPRAPNQTVVVVSGDNDTGGVLAMICEFLDLQIEHVTDNEDLALLLRMNPPLAVIADLDGGGQDGCHVMKAVATFDRDLPVMLLTDGNPAYLGAVDAVQEAFALTRVATVKGTDNIGPMVDFLCHATRDAGVSRMMRL